MIQNEQENAFYAIEDRRNNPKEYFQLINDQIKDMKWKTLCDVGCATGDFLHYIRSQYGEEKILSGIDNFDKLRNIAVSRLPECKFYKGDIQTGEGLPNEKFDIVCMSGVLSYLPDFKASFENLINMIKNDGIALIFAQFNSHDCHSEVNFRLKDREGTHIVYSINEISEWLMSKKYDYEFIPFKIKTVIKEKKEEPTRSYTISLADGTNGLVNGIDLWIEQYLLKICK